MSVKVWAYLGIVVALLGGVRWAYVAAYDAGFNAAVLEQKDLIQAAKDAARKKEREHWIRIVEEAEAQVIIEERIVEVERVITEEIPVVVETVRNECRDLGPDVSGLLTAQALALPGAGGTDTGIPAEPDPSL